ncbi:hypothetical protein TWF694_006311 [Orbilia ellipsospora]|uniref:Extracellular membrane protein CFEM domain-containing protein n=1 Tax=Orbilia ellipsospora TaxID=2528407 RepID=A0AAV9XL80_9PEZI
MQKVISFITIATLILGTFAAPTAGPVGLKIRSSTCDASNPDADATCFTECFKDGSIDGGRCGPDGACICEDKGSAFTGDVLVPGVTREE